MVKCLPSKAFPFRMRMTGSKELTLVEEGPPPLTIRQRVQKLRAWMRQRKLDQRIEGLRKQQRLRELGERRAQRKVEEARARTLKAMGIDPTAKPKGGGGVGGDASGSAMLRTEEL